MACQQVGEEIRRAIRIDRSVALIDGPHSAYNRYHPDIVPILDVGEGEEVILDTRDKVDGQIM